MDMKIIPMTASHAEAVIEMMRSFYASEAVLTNGSEEIFAKDVDACISGCPYLEGYVFEGAQGLQGYTMVAKSFSTEYGKPCIWIEDLYVLEAYRGTGIGTAALHFIKEKYPHALLRLEVEAENEKARRVYEACGFEVLPYMEMKKE